VNARTLFAIVALAALALLPGLAVSQEQGEAPLSQEEMMARWKKWVMSWADTSTTALYVAEGPVSDPTGMTMSLYGELDEFLTGECDKPFRWTIRKDGEDKFTFEIWDLGIGADGRKVMEIGYTRRKAG